MGLAPPRRGKVSLRGAVISGQKPHHIARAGLGFVPEDRQIFPEHTVEDNLVIGRKKGPEGQDEWPIKRIYEVFPLLEPLRHRIAGRLSGGEQQMLAIARTLMGNPALLLLDEPSEGLAPIIVQRIGELLRQLRQLGSTVLIAEQNMVKVLKERGYNTDLQYAEDDIPNQLSQVENMVTKGAKALVIAAIDGTTLSDVLKQAKAKGITVIAYDRLIRGTPNVDYYATFDNFQVGVLQAESIVQGLGLKDGKGPFNIELFGGSPDDNNAYFFYNGAMVIFTVQMTWKAGRKHPNRAALLWSVGCSVMAFLGAGVWGFLHTLSSVNYYTHGTQVTAAHGHLAFFGAYVMLNLSVMAYAIPQIKGRAPYNQWLSMASFWIML